MPVNSDGCGLFGSRSDKLMFGCGWFIQDRSLGQAGMPGSAILHHWETLMPLFTVTMKVGRAADEKNALPRAIHEASVKAGYPDDDMFQRFFVLSRPT